MVHPFSSILGLEDQLKLTKFTINFTRFTKGRFVRDKNPQRRHISYHVQLFILNKNVTSILKFKQRFMFYFKYFNFFLNFTLFFLFTPCLFQIVANFIKNHTTVSAMFLFSSCATIFLSTGCCGAKVTQNEKLLPFGGRCLNLKKEAKFGTRGKFWIR